MKKMILSVMTVGILSSSVFGVDAYYAHINQEDETLIEVNENPQRINEKDEILKITANGIYLHSHGGGADTASGKTRSVNSVKSFSSKEVTNSLICSSHPDEETKEKQNILCQSIFVSWSGNVGSTLVNAIYSPLANIALAVRTLGKDTIQGYKHFAAIDDEKIEKFAEKNNLKEYQVKLITRN